MAAENATAVKIKQSLVPPIRHPIKAAGLLFTPPKFILHGPIYVIFIVTFGALLYSFWASVDTIVTAPLSLLRESTTVESVGGGMVVDIGAKSDEFIRYGDLLVAIQEQTRITADTEQDSLSSRRYELNKELDKTKDEYENTISQLELDLKNFDTEKAQNIKAGEGRVKNLTQQLATARGTLKRAQGRLNTAQKQFARKKQLFDNRDITVSEFEGAQERVNEYRKGVDDARGEVAQIKVNLATAKGELEKLQDIQAKEKLELELAQTRERRDRDVKRLQERIASLEKKLVEGQKLVEGVTFKENTTQYKSNFDGLITQVHIKKRQIIGVGSPLVTIVRDTAPLMARVLVPNESIGRLKKGQEVKIKYFAYPYQEYGIKEGVITSIATRPGGVDDKPSMYLVMVALKSEEIRKPGGGKAKPLEIGLEGTADIKVGEKRLIELVFRPASKFFAGEEE